MFARRAPGGPGPATRRIVAGLLLGAVAAGCAAPAPAPTAVQVQVSRAEAIERAVGQIDRTSNYCGFSTCPSISPRPLVVESATLDAAARHAIPGSPIAERLERDPAAQVWAVVVGLGSPPEQGRTIFLVDPWSGAVLMTAPFDDTYRDLVDAAEGATDGAGDPPAPP